MQPRFARLAAALLVTTLFVILWGAWVRITGSGAGCGDHWPTCHGELIPRSPTEETIIEFTHRVTSGLVLIGAVAVFWAARRVWPTGHPGRRYALASLVFMVIEALIGAVLVLVGLVAQNDSVARAFVMAIHLANTLILVAAIFATWATAAIRRIPRPSTAPGLRPTIVGAAILLIVLCMTGAVTALGDTLYPIDPATGLRDRIADHLSPYAHFLVRMRIAHPTLSLVASLALLLGVLRFSEASGDASARTAGRAFAAAIVAQVACGLLNIWLHAPGWMQILHLLLANVVWLAFLAWAWFETTAPTASDRPTRPDGTTADVPAAAGAT